MPVTQHRFRCVPPVRIRLVVSGVSMSIGDVIKDFLCLLDRFLNEEEIHQFLCTHPYFLPGFLDAHTGVFSKVSLGNDFVTDFTFGRHGTAGTSWNLIELERPDYRLFTKAGNISSQLSHAITQVSQWRSWVGRHYAYAEQVLPHMIILNTVIIIGRRESLSKNDLHLLAELNRGSVGREIVTFDRLADNAMHISQWMDLDRVSSALTFQELKEGRFRHHTLDMPWSRSEWRRIENQRGSCWFRTSFLNPETGVEWLKCAVSEDNRCQHPSVSASECPLYPEQLKQEL